MSVVFSWLADEAAALAAAAAAALVLVRAAANCDISAVSSTVGAYKDISIKQHERS